MWLSGLAEEAPLAFPPLQLKPACDPCCPPAAGHAPPMCPPGVAPCLRAGGASHGARGAEALSEHTCLRGVPGGSPAAGGVRGEPVLGRGGQHGWGVQVWLCNVSLWSRS